MYSSGRSVFRGNSYSGLDQQPPNRQQLLAARRPPEQQVSTPSATQLIGARVQCPRDDKATPGFTYAGCLGSPRPAWGSAGAQAHRGSRSAQTVPYPAPLSAHALPARQGERSQSAAWPWPRWPAGAPMAAGSPGHGGTEPLAARRRWEVVRPGPGRIMASRMCGSHRTVGAPPCVCPGATVNLAARPSVGASTVAKIGHGHRHR